MNDQNPHANITYDDVKKMTTELSAPGGGQGPVADKVNGALINEFRAKGGTIGGEVGDASELLLVTVIGAKTGLERVIPLVYFRVGERLVVIASMGGSDKHPTWYLNMQANPDVTVEIGAEVCQATAIDTSGTDRDKLFRAVCETNPVFARYQDKTTRMIPVVELVLSTS